MESQVIGENYHGLGLRTGSSLLSPAVSLRAKQFHITLYCSRRVHIHDIVPPTLQLTRELRNRVCSDSLNAQHNTTPESAHMNACRLVASSYERNNGTMILRINW